MKKIIILTSRGGGGHISVSNALEQCLKNEYHVQQVFAFCDILGGIDPVHLFSRGRYSGEMIYNWLIRKRCYRLLNLMERFGAFWMATLWGARAEKKLHAFFEQEKPDLIISVIPIINQHVLSAAQKLAIPLIIIPTDLDTHVFTYRMRKPNYDKLYFTLPFDLELIRNTLASAQIPEHNIHQTGFVLRDAFFNDADQTKIKKEFAIMPNKPVIMVLMGAVGSDTTVLFAKEFQKITQPAHFVFCIGRNEKIRAQIEAINFPSHLTHSIVGFTDQIANLMKVSDLLITKSGSVSFCEGMYANLPMLLDATSTVLLWEQLNHTLAEQEGFGYSIKSYVHARHVLQQLLEVPEQLAWMRKNLEKIKKKNGCAQMRKLVEKILA